jgi:hypothetical protein
MLNCLKDSRLLQFLLQADVVSPLESHTSGLHVYPEKGIQWSKVRGARGPGYWFQHDDATTHCTNVSIWMKIFGSRWIRRGGPITWPLRSSSLDFIGFKYGNLNYIPKQVQGSQFCRKLRGVWIRVILATIQLETFCFLVCCLKT